MAFSLVIAEARGQGLLIKLIGGILGLSWKHVTTAMYSELLLNLG